MRQIVHIWEQRFRPNPKHFKERHTFFHSNIELQRPGDDKIFCGFSIEHDRQT